MGAVNLDQSIKHSPPHVAWREQLCPLQNWGFLAGPSLKTVLLKGEGGLRKEASSRLWCSQPMKSIQGSAGSEPISRAQQSCLALSEPPLLPGCSSGPGGA